MKKEEYISKYGEEWYEEHIVKRTRKHHQDHKEEDKQYKQNHKEEISEYMKQWHQDNKEKHNEQNKQWREDNPIQYRANMLLNNYRQSDNDTNRGECTLTADWIINNIFNSKCVFCGESDWEKLGCDRIDNSKPHTVDNVQCCCYKCNTKRGVKTLQEFLEQMKNGHIF